MSDIVQDTDELASALEAISSGKINDSEEVEVEEEVKEDGQEEEQEEKQEDEVKEEEEKDSGVEEKEKEKEEEVSVSSDEIRDLRQALRTMKKELALTKAKLNRQGVLKKKESDYLDDEEEQEENTEEKLSEIEELQQSITDVSSRKGEALDLLFETMSESGRYPEITEVCSRRNFDEFLDLVSENIVDKNGGDFDTVRLQAELEVWNMKNPYKFMYEGIKKVHPAFKEKAEKKEEVVVKKKTPKPPVDVKAPSTVVNKGSNADSKGGWTAAKIDVLYETELSKVPKDIYNKYLMGELD